MKGHEGERKLVKVGNYAMTGRLLGKGHFARVHEATHIHLNVKVAVKVLTLSEVKDEYVIKNMRREARILARVSHPNVVYLFETITTTKRYYIVTELVNGCDLCSHITAQRAGKLDEKSTRVLARQIISAVSHLHELGIVHRDLKMENILLDSAKENVKLVDFGLSNYRKGGRLLQTHCGSPEYAAPELYVKGQQYGPEVDIWSLGIIFYGMLVGKLPFQSWHKAGLSIEAKRKQLIRETKIGLTQRHHMSLMDASLLFRNLLERMVCPNPEERITMINLQSHAWVYGRFYKQYPQLDCNWVKRALHRIAKMVKLPVAEVCQTIETKRYSPLAGIYNIAKLRELQKRIEAEDFKNESKETKKKRYIHIDLYEGSSKPRRPIKDPHETIPLVVPTPPFKTHNPTCQKQRPATLGTDEIHTPRKSTSTQKRFATGLGAAISKILHKRRSPPKQGPMRTSGIVQGKELRMNKEFCGFPTHTAARAESDKHRR